jgi:hypothetical protein
MDKQKHLYWAFQSSQTLEPTEKQLELFQRKYKENFEQRTVYEGQELLDKYRLNGWRNPMFSDITSIILAFEHEGTLRVKFIEGTESDLLQNFVNLMRNSFQDYKLVHFDAGIVLPYIGTRLLKNGLNNPHNDLKYQGQNFKPWNLTGTDIKDYFKGAGDYSYSLEEIAYILNIDCEGIIPYEDEVTYYANKDFESLNKSAVKKIETLSKIHRRLNNLEELETVIVKETVKNVVEEKPKDWLKELYYANQMTIEIKEGLKQQIFGGKKPLKKDLENLFTIIRGVYVKTDFISGQNDSKKTIELKEREIKELLGL